MPHWTFFVVTEQDLAEYYFVHAKDCGKFLAESVARNIAEMNDDCVVGNFIHKVIFFDLIGLNYNLFGWIPAFD